MLVESLRYAIFDGYASSDRSNYGALKLVSRRGVLVDNACFREDVTDNYATVTNLSGDPIRVQKPENVAAAANGVLPSPEASTAGTAGIQSGDTEGTTTVTYTACYRKDVGRYRISSAMVVVLTTLMASAFEENFSNIGDVFERAVAKFLYFAVQVFHGRRVSELVDFIVGPRAVVGRDVREVLDGAGVVTYSSLTLWVSGALNAKRALAANKKEKQFLNEADKRAARQLRKLWRAQTHKATPSESAWVEVSPSGLPSADIVLHIPGVITLPMQCKDVGSTFETERIGTALNSMRCVGDRWIDPQNRKRAAAQDLFARKLRDLGAPVVPVLYVSHAATLGASTMTNAIMSAIGPRCIMAEGIGERDVKDSEHYRDAISAADVGATNAARRVPGRDVMRNDIRLHRIRRSLMLFDFRREEPLDVVDLATAPAALPFGDAAAVYDGSRFMYSEHVAKTLRNTNESEHTAT
jgi:hypothetical protein